MNYTKPEIEVLGNAVAVIEQITLKDSGDPDGSTEGGGRVNTAYDLDE